MARLVERLLVWLAVVVVLAAALAVVVTVLPQLNLPTALSRPLYWLRAHQPSANERPAIERAEDLLASGDASGALAAAREAVDSNRGDAGVANRAGNVALRAGDDQAAERYYLLGENADRSFAWNFLALGQLYERRGDREKADAQLRAAVVAAPTMAFLHYDLGVVELEEHLYAAALADFSAELSRSPDYKPAIIGRAEALDRLGRRGEALASYRRAGISPASRAHAPPPRLAVRALVQPSPSPTAVALASPTATPTPTPTPAAARVKARTPAPATHLVLTQVPTPRPTAASALPPWARPANQSSARPAATANGPQMTQVIAEARSYVSGVSEDLNFTRALPAADPTQSTNELVNKLNQQLSNRSLDIEGALRTGTAALLTGRLGMAMHAFTGVANDAPRDWRGPYLAGLTAQAEGDTDRARGWFREAAAREARPEPYTSLAIIDVTDGNIGSAAANSRQAAALDPTYEPGRFVAGMVDLMQQDVPGAERNLEAALALGGAPSRTEYFINALQQSVGETALPSS